MTQSFKPRYSPLCKLIRKFFPVIALPTHHSSLVIPIHTQGELQISHPDYPSFGRGIIAARPSQEGYNCHMIYRTPILPAPWFAAVIRKPSDSFPYIPLQNSLTSRNERIFTDMVMICEEGVWIVRVEKDNIAEIVKALKELPLPKDKLPVPLGGQYFEPKVLR